MGIPVAPSEGWYCKVLSVLRPILGSVHWSLTEVLICISFRTNDTGYFSLCLFAIHPSVFVNCLPVLKYQVVCFLTVEVKEFFIYSGHISFVVCMICKYFLPVCGSSFILLLMFSEKLSSQWSQTYQLVLYLKNLCLTQILKGFLLGLLVRSFRCYI